MTGWPALILGPGCFHTMQSCRSVSASARWCVMQVGSFAPVCIVGKRCMQLRETLIQRQETTGHAWRVRGDLWLGFERVP